MMYKQFDVVKLKDANKAIILQVNKNDYLAEIVNSNGLTLDRRLVYENENEIETVLYTRKDIKYNL